MPSKFKKLAENKNLVLLSRAPLGKKCQTTFYHSVVGVPMMDDEVHFVALANMKFSTGVELHPASLFTSTSEKFVPSVLELM